MQLEKVKCLVLAFMALLSTGQAIAHDHAEAVLGRTGYPVTARTHHATGMIKSISGTRVTITHAPIAELHWPAMTMAFDSANPLVLSRMRPGRQMQFDFIRAPGGRLLILTVQPAR